MIVFVEIVSACISLARLPKNILQPMLVCFSPLSPIPPHFEFCTYAYTRIFLSVVGFGGLEKDKGSEKS